MMHSTLLATLERIAAAKNLPDPKILLAVDAERKRKEHVRNLPWYIKIYDGYKRDET